MLSVLNSTLDNSIAVDPFAVFVTLTKYETKSIHLRKMPHDNKTIDVNFSWKTRKVSLGYHPYLPLEMYLHLATMFSLHLGKIKTIICGTPTGMHFPHVNLIFYDAFKQPLYDFYPLLVL